MAGQSATVVTAMAVIGNRRAIALPHHVDVKIHQAFARSIRRNRAHAVGCMAHRTGEALPNYVPVVLPEADVSHDVAQIMTLGAHAIGSVEAEVWIGERIRCQSAWCRSLGKLIVVLEDVRVDRSVGTVRPSAAKFAIVVAVVAIGAEDLDSHEARCRAILIQHVGA